MNIPRDKERGIFCVHEAKEKAIKKLYLVTKNKLSGSQKNGENEIFNRRVGN